MSIDRTPKDWVAGEDLTAADMDAEIRDLWTGLQAAWTAYTPTWTAATSNPTLGNGSFDGSAYHRVGKTIIGRIVLTMGGTTAYGTGSWSLTLPVAAAAGAGRTTCRGLARDTSASADYPLVGILTASSTTLAVRRLPAVAGDPFAVVAAANPFTWASTDVLTFDFCYEAA